MAQSWRQSAGPRKNVEKLHSSPANWTHIATDKRREFVQMNKYNITISNLHSSSTTPSISYPFPPMWNWCRVRNGGRERLGWNFWSETCTNSFILDVIRWRSQCWYWPLSSKLPQPKDSFADHYCLNMLKHSMESAQEKMLPGLNHLFKLFIGICHTE